ncbi:MAG: 3'-5' exonuclease [Bacteroidales bacterium]|nr:3'-5' exonuclease [Bacteroidales bacterium]
MKLNLNKPLLFFDLETTGTDIVHDRIVEIAMLKLMPNGNQEMKVLRVNPEMPIPPEATKVHGITNDDVRNEPPFKALARGIADFMAGCDLAGFNSNRFDLPLLAEELMRAGLELDLKQRKLIDVLTIFHRMEPRTLTAAYRFYCQKELTDAHSAAADTQATFEVLQAQLDHYPELPNDMAALDEFCGSGRTLDLVGRIVLNEAGVPTFNFGKHKGKPVADVLRQEPSYYSWMMNGDFSLYTKKMMTSIYLSLKQK